MPFAQIYMIEGRTEEQKKAMAKLIVQLKQQFPTIHKVLGHRDLPNVRKDCPCFDVRDWLEDIDFHI